VTYRKKTSDKQPMLDTYYDHNTHQFLPKASDPRDFISEDDLNTLQGFLRYHAVDPATASPEHLAHFQKLFESRKTAPKFGAMKLPPMEPGEHRYAVALREGSDLWLTTWVRRMPKGDIYVMTPRADDGWDPHISYHRDGNFHAKSFGQKLLPSKRQAPLANTFRGAANICMLTGHGPKTVGAVCDPTMFTEVVEVPPDILGPRDGFVAVDLVEPGYEPSELPPHTLSQHHVFKHSEPWIVIRVGKLAPL
jgi:hypothetical protein